MISKKDALTLGMLAVGGVGAAMVLSGGAEGEGLGGGGGGFGLGEEEPEAMTKKETIEYAKPGVIAPPKLPSFVDVFKPFLPVTIPTTPTTKTSKIGLLTPSRPGGVRPYLYTGGDVTSGAYSLIPSAATGVQPYLYTGGAVRPGAFTVYGAPPAPKKSSSGRTKRGGWAKSSGRAGFGGSRSG